MTALHHPGGVGRERVRVLHVIQNLNYGGMERLLADLVREIDQSRFESHILALRYLGRFAEGLEEYATLHVGVAQSRWSIIQPRALAAQIRAIAPDVVHTHSGVWYKASLAARMAGVPMLIHTDHGRRSPDPWMDRLLDGRASRRTDVIVAVSDALAAQLSAFVSDPRRVKVIRNGVDTTLYRPAGEPGPLRQELGVPADTPILGSIGRLESIKGYDVMIRAFATLLRTGSAESTSPQPILVLVGDGSERPALEQLANKLDCASRVRFLGWRDDVGSLHSAFTLYTMSSRSEGTSVSLLEAMSAGLCPVVTDVGGNAAVLGEQLRHRLVPSESPDALARAWDSALSDEQARQRDAVAARNRVQDAFSLTAMVRQYEAVYATVLLDERG